MFESIETDRLIICGFKKEEWKDVYVYTSDPIVMEYIPEGVFSENDAKEFIEKNIGEKAQKYAVILRNEIRLIGHMAFHKWFGDHTYEIGWVFNKDYHNKGYATEAARALLKYGFEEMKLHRIIATCQPDNPPSYRVMEKIGMRREGYFKKCIKRDTGWWDEYFYAILDEEWKKG
jgi:[ribosomal protein S5]-alanine N-acetyltransferase